MFLHSTESRIHSEVNARNEYEMHTENQQKKKQIEK